MPDVTKVTVNEITNTVTVNEVDPTQVYVQFPGVAGATGEAGASLLSGSVVPSSGIGKNGDHYINTATRDFYGPKTAGVWPLVPSFNLGSGSALRYVHTQAIAASTWTINHNLGTKPNIVIVDSSNTHLFGDVTYVSNSQVILSFSVPFSGYAYLS